MKQMIGSIAVLLILGAASVNAQQSQRREMAEKLLDVMNMQDSIEQSFSMIKQMIPAQTEQLHATADKEVTEHASRHTTRLVEMISDELSWENMKKEYIALYVN